MVKKHGGQFLQSIKFFEVSHPVVDVRCENCPSPPPVEVLVTFEVSHPVVDVRCKNCPSPPPPVEVLVIFLYYWHGVLSLLNF